MNDLWNGPYYKQHSIFQETAALEILKCFPFKGTERVLDIGCGTGNISKQVADLLPEGEVIGIDPSAQMLNQAISDYKKISNLNFLCKKAEDFHFDQKFDVVISFHALHFVKDHKRAFERIHSSLVPGGKILLQMGSKFHSTMEEVFARKPWCDAFNTKDSLFPMTKDKALLLLKKLGFNKIQVTVSKRTHYFSSPQKLIECLMTWLCHLSKLPEERTLKLAQEVTERICQKENCQKNIPLQFNPIIMTAQTPV